MMRTTFLAHDAKLAVDGHAPQQPTFVRSRLRTTLVVATVVAAHGAAAWALHDVLAPNATVPPRPTVVSVVFVPQPTTPLPPSPEVRPSRQPTRTAPVQRSSPPMPAVAQTTSTATETPVTPTTPEPEVVATPANTVPAPVAAAPAPVAPAPPVPAAPAPPRIELPSASAAYLSNPPPPYPPLSRRLGEQGKVVLRVRIEPDGTASAAEIRTSSGYERLDQAALQTVLRWRYVPGTRNGVPEAMWFLIPIQFVLE